MICMMQDVEYGVDSRYKNQKEKKSESIALMQARLERMKLLPKEQITKAKLFQLKLKMENFLKAPVSDNEQHFCKFLETYIDAIYDQRNRFAKDMSINSVYLSQVINKHREPNDEFILKLMIHSEKAYQKIGSFNKMIWYQIFFHEKLSNTISTQSEWRPRIEKQVSLSELVVK
jgi:hypothetical protein